MVLCVMNGNTLEENASLLHSYMMNGKFIAITLVTIMSIMALGQLHSANAELQSGKSYIIYANGHDVGNNLEYTLELQLLIGSGSDKIPIYLVEGLIIHDNQDFVTSSNWKGTLLKNDGLIMLSGNATTYDGTQLSMILFGKFVNNTNKPNNSSQELQVNIQILDRFHIFFFKLNQN